MHNEGTGSDPEQEGASSLQPTHTHKHTTHTLTHTTHTHTTHTLMHTTHTPHYCAAAY